MRGFLDFFKTTLIGGFIVVLPVALVIFLLGQAVAAVVIILAPLLDEMNIQELGGIGIVTLLALLLVFLLCFITGLLIRTGMGKATGGWVERKLLKRLPVYTMIKNLTRQFSGAEGTEFAPALVDLYNADARSLAFIVEEHDDGRFAVFVPLTPMPAIGHVHLLPRERVRRIEAPLGEVVNSITQWGVESKKLFQKADGAA
jgi:uncharacterized membrane protein